MDYISKIEGHPIKAECLKESPRLTDTTPYLFRPSYANGYGYETLKGGTVAFNQLADNTSVTVTAGGNQNINFNSTKYGIISGHKYLISCRQNTTLTSIDRNTFVVRDDDNSQNYYQNATSNFHLSAGTYYWLYNSTFTSGGFFRLWSNNPNEDVAYDNFQVFDLTQMFGSTIADYVYTLESGTSGAGITWLKNNGFFGADYYPYNAGGLLSVKTSKKINTGANWWGDEKLADDICTAVSTSAKSSDSNGKYVNVLAGAAVDDVAIFVAPFKENTQYSFIVKARKNNTNPSTNLAFQYTDGTQSAIQFPSAPVVGDVYTFVVTSTASKTISCIKGFWGSGESYLYYENCGVFEGIKTVSEYQPYVSHEYPLDDIELRGILKLDGNNNLYYDGDTYESNGDVTRKYAIEDLSLIQNSIEYNAALGAWIVYQLTPAKYAGWNGVPNVFDITGKTPTYYGDENRGDNKITTDSAGHIIIGNNSSVDKPNYLVVFERATPTTETADPFTNPMIVDGNGTEEFVDTRAVQMPVGHETIYVDNSDKTKLDNLPDISDSGDGKYLIKQENGKQSLITPNATDISYSNTSSGLTATKVQGAIDEVNTKVGTKANSSDVYTKSQTYSSGQIDYSMNLKADKSELEDYALKTWVVTNFVDAAYLGTHYYNKSQVDNLLTDMLPVGDASGNIASFETEIAGRLQSLKANFICGGGNGTPSTPIPLVPLTELNVTNCGVNLWNEEWELGGINAITGEPETNNTRIRSTDFCICAGNDSYYGYIGTASVSLLIYWYDSNKTFISRSDITNDTVTSPLNARYFKVMTYDNLTPHYTDYQNDISVIYPNNAPHSYHAYNADTITIDLDGTRYGGYVDANNGKLVVTHIIIDDLSTLTFTMYSVSQGNLFRTALDDIKTIDSDYIVASMLCTSYPVVSSNDRADKTLSQVSNLKRIDFINNDYSDATSFRNSISGQKLVYELATPIEVDISPEHLYAHTGVNNVFHDGNGNMTVKYLKGSMAKDIKTVIGTTNFADLSDIPNPPTTDGNYRLIVTITDGKPTYSWEEIT